MDELPIVCDRDALSNRESERQRILWTLVSNDVEERRELPEGYALKLPAERLAAVAELMRIERRCCGFLELRLDSKTSKTHIWFELTGPPGTKALLDVELERMLTSRPRSL